MCANAFALLYLRTCTSACALRSHQLAKERGENLMRGKKEEREKSRERERMKTKRKS